MISGAAGVGFGGGYSFLVFGAPSSLVNALRSMGPLGMSLSIDAIVLACQGAGVLWGTAESSAASVGATAYVGEIVTVQRAARHETGD